MEDSTPESLIPLFIFEKLLNQDQAGRRIVLQGHINSQPALLIAERAAFAADYSFLTTFANSLSHIKNLGDNDVYRWYMASTASSSSSTSATAPAPDLKLNLIYPCTPQHVKKYSRQPVRSVSETPDIYEQHVRPYMEKQRLSGRLNWVFNIIEGRTEQENVLYRSPEGTEAEKRFLLLPDLNWDRETVGSLHLLALVERRDVWSVRDLNRGHVSWLREMVESLKNVVGELYGRGGTMRKDKGGENVQADMLKFYVHYHPTYYHFHIHIVHLGLESGATQAVGKALSLNNIISQLETMNPHTLDGREAGIQDVELTFTLGEQSELWTEIFGPLSRGEKVPKGQA